ncbi:hypothetical protein [Hymenobacter sp.]|jgi:hypothetical protein|uniref:hypothetical protein n=1 Tax=Hymenobacter sp. TaxID=1898978 RepID=UPI002ED970D8
MNYSAAQQLILLAVIPNAFTAVVAAMKWKYLPATLRPIALLAFFSLLIEVISRGLWLFKLSNLFLWPIYISVEFGLLVWLYRQALGSRLLARFGGALIVGMAVVALTESGLRQAQPTRIDNAVRLLESLLVMGFALSYYHTSLRRVSTAFIWQEPLFWVSTGLLFFFAGNFLIYTFVNFALYYQQRVVIQFWVIHAALSSLLYCTYAYALWISPKS